MASFYSLESNYNNWVSKTLPETTSSNHRRIVKHGIPVIVLLFLVALATTVTTGSALHVQPGYKTTIVYNNISDFTITLNNNESIVLKGNDIIKTNCTYTLTVYPNFSKNPILVLDLHHYCNNTIRIYEYKHATGVSSLILVFNVHEDVSVLLANTSITSVYCSLSPIESIGLIINIGVPVKPDFLYISSYLFIKNKRYEIPSTFFTIQEHRKSIALRFSCNLPLNYALTPGRSLAIVLKVPSWYYIILIDVERIMLSMNTTIASSPLPSGAKQSGEYNESSENISLLSSGYEGGQTGLTEEGAENTIRKYIAVTVALFIIASIILRLVSTRMKTCINVCLISYKIDLDREDKCWAKIAVKR